MPIMRRKLSGTEQRNTREDITLIIHEKGWRRFFVIQTIKIVNVNNRKPIMPSAFMVLKRDKFMTFKNFSNS